jgi:hypothetical protein
MTAQEEISRLQAKIADGSLSPDEPLFVLRAKDAFASLAIDAWSRAAHAAGAPMMMLDDAAQCAAAMRKWPVKEVPGTGRPYERNYR